MRFGNYGFVALQSVAQHAYPSLEKPSACKTSHRRLADAIGFMEKRKLGEVPTFVNDWRARQESNL